MPLAACSGNVDSDDADGGGSDGGRGDAGGSDGGGGGEDGDGGDTGPEAAASLFVSLHTDLQVPKDFDVLSVYVSYDGAPETDFLGRTLPEGTVVFPSVLEIARPNAGATLRLRVTALKTQSAGGAQALILRDVVTTPPPRRAVLRVDLNLLDIGSAEGTLPSAYVPGENGAPEGDTVFDPTTLASSCDFSEGMTSIDGQCASAAVDSSTLPSYDGPDAGGNQPSSVPASPCFDVTSCFAGATPVQGLDAQTCSFPLPSGVDASHLNLAIQTPSLGACLGAGECLVPLANDPAEGWVVNGGNVQLPPAVCAKLGNGANLLTSGSACLAETPALDVCQSYGSSGDGADASLD